MESGQVGRVRSFNRLLGETIGALDDRFLGRDRPMGEARLLWEVGDGVDVRDVRQRLGLDPGYLSRLVGSLRRQGLIELTTDAADRRVRRIVPTAAGRVERVELDRRSDDLAAALLDPLEPTERAQLVAAMGEVERLLVRSRTTASCRPRRPTPMCGGASTGTSPSCGSASTTASTSRAATAWTWRT